MVGTPVTKKTLESSELIRAIACILFLIGAVGSLWKIKIFIWVGIVSFLVMFKAYSKLHKGVTQIGF